MSCDSQLPDFPLATGYRNTLLHSNNLQGAVEPGHAGALGHPELSGHHVPITHNASPKDPKSVARQFDAFCRLQLLPNDPTNLQTALYMGHPSLASIRPDASMLSIHQRKYLSHMHRYEDKGGIGRHQLTQAVTESYASSVSPSLPVNRSLSEMAREHDICLHPPIPSLLPPSLSPSYPFHPPAGSYGISCSSSGHAPHTEEYTLMTSPSNPHVSARRLSAVGGYANAGFAPGCTLDPTDARGKVLPGYGTSPPARTQRKSVGVRATNASRGHCSAAQHDAHCSTSAGTTMRKRFTTSMRTPSQLASRASSCARGTDVQVAARGMIGSDRGSGAARLSSHLSTRATHRQGHANAGYDGTSHFAAEATHRVRARSGTIRKVAPPPRVAASVVDVHSRVAAAGMVRAVGAQSELLRDAHAHNSLLSRRLARLERQLHAKEAKAQEDQHRIATLEATLGRVMGQRAAQERRRSLSPTDAALACMAADVWRGVPGGEARRLAVLQSVGLDEGEEGEDGEQKENEKEERQRDGQRAGDAAQRGVHRSRTVEWGGEQKESTNTDQRTSGDAREGTSALGSHPNVVSASTGTPVLHRRSSVLSPHSDLTRRGSLLSSRQNGARYAGSSGPDGKMVSSPNDVRQGNVASSASVAGRVPLLCRDSDVRLPQNPRRDSVQSGVDSGGNRDGHEDAYGYVDMEDERDDKERAAGTVVRRPGISRDSAGLPCVNAHTAGGHIRVNGELIRAVCAETPRVDYEANMWGFGDAAQLTR